MGPRAGCSQWGWRSRNPDRETGTLRSVEPAKVAFLFEEVPDGIDPDDADDRAELLAEQIDDPDSAGAIGTLAYEVLAEQIASGDPPVVWETAKRLLGSGIDRIQVLHNLALALTGQLQAALEAEQRFDPDAYAAALAHLPLPPARDIVDAMVQVVIARQALSIDEVEAAAMARLGLPADIEPFRTLLDRVSDRAVMEGEGDLELLAGDRVVHRPTLCAGLVLTHRVSAAEQEIDCLTAGVDLAGFVREPGPLHTAAGDELEPFSVEPGHVAWHGPGGWLAGFAADAVLAVRLDGDVVHIEALDSELPTDPELVARVRAVYDTEVAEGWMPVSAEEILLGLLVEDRALFREPRAPLRALCEAAGLDQDGVFFAHEASVWEERDRARRTHRVVVRLDDSDDRHAVLSVLDRFDEGADDPAELSDALDACASPRLLEVIVDELFGDDDARTDDVAAFAQRLLGAATRPRHVAAARWLAAVAEERRGDPLAARAQLELAVEADGEWGPGVDRLAWYRSDGGDAAGAARLWRRLGVGPERNADLRQVMGFATAATAKLGRNDPCWCGSGRKYKHCHLDHYELPPLPDRVGWLCRKATAYLERRGGQAAADVAAIAEARAGDDPDDEAWARALDDPLVIDVALCELGWFRRFLADRGPLLPDDEALLATSWALVERTLYEIEAVRPRVGLTLCDLRSAEHLEVRERTFSRSAKVGTVVCGRAVPDGETHQLIGGLFPVAPGTEAAVLDLLDEGDGVSLVSYVAALERPPVLETREGEPLVACTAVLHVPDPGAARSTIGRRYRDEGNGTWVELHELADGDAILRATLRLDGDRLTVETMSEHRLDRVLRELRNALPDAQVVSEDRTPLHSQDDVEDMRPPGGAAPSLPDDPVTRQVAEEWRERHEERWCDESIPALAGLTPRQAAADPTRREILERLIASFEPGGVDSVFLGLRPDRLRRHLGLD
jgi:hypothetical protein